MACGITPSLEGLVARIVRFSNDNKTIDTTGSIGPYIRIAIKRNGVIIERSKVETNTGTNQIAFQMSLKNGDKLCTQVSRGKSFFTGEYVEDCRIIPIPNLGFIE